MPASLLLRFGFAILLMSSFAVNAQHRCASDKLHLDRMATDPVYKQNMDVAEEAIYQRTLQLLEDRYERGIPNETITHPENICSPGNQTFAYLIPVVVHIMHNNGSENISDAQVFQAMDHLNDAFRNRGVYDPSVGADVQIEFCLAVRDPNGASTNGINRVVTTLTNLDMSTNDQNLKNLSRWDTKEYVNIWTVREICDGASCGVAGYAYLAGAHGQPYDGIVVESKWFGTSSGNSTVHIHEMGHYMNLFHPFQNGCPNNNCLTNGDRVCDTPPDQSTSPVNCSNTQNSCTTDADDASMNNPFTTDVPDNDKLYMDYSLNACMNQFSQGQKDRMLTALTTTRASLISSMGCVPVTTNDVVLVSIDYPEWTPCENPFQPIITIENRGTAPLSSMNIEVLLNSFTQYTMNWIGSVPSGNTATIVLNALTVTGGTQNLEVVLTNPSGNTDQYPADNTACRDFQYYVPRTELCADIGMPSPVLPDKWEIDDPDGIAKWEIATAACFNDVLRINSFNKNVGPLGTVDEIVLPALDLSNYASAQLDFYIAHKQGASDRQGILNVLVSTDCGQTYTVAYSKTGAALATIAGTETATAWAPTACTDWRKETVNLTPFVGGNSRIRIQYEVDQYHAQNLYIDSICMDGVFLDCPVELGNDTTVCGPFEISAGDKFLTYKWSTGSTDTAIVATVNGDYWVTVTGPGGCTGADTITLQVNQPAIAALPDTLNICEPTTLDPGPIGDFYLWSTGASTRTIEADTSGTYAVTVTRVNGCSDTAATVIKRHPFLAADAGRDTTVCMNETIVLGGATPAQGGNPPYSYSWTPVAGISNPNIANPFATIAASNNYVLTISDDSGCTKRDTMVVAMMSLPIPDAGPDTTVCIGVPVTIGGLVPAFGTAPPFTYGWTPAIFVNDDTLGNPSATVKGKTNFTLTVTDTNGCKATDKMVVDVLPQPRARAGNGVIKCDPAPVKLGETPAATGGTPPYTYSWFPPAGLTATNVPNPLSSPQFTTHYELTVTDSNGCFDRDTVPVIVSPGMFPNAGPDTTICAGHPLQLGGNPTPNGGLSPHSFSWIPATNLNSNTVANPIATPTKTTTFTVYVSDANGCVKTDTVRVEVRPSPSAEAGGATFLCTGSSAPIGGFPTGSGGSGQLSYFWTPNIAINGQTSANPIVSPPNTVTYTVRVTDSVGCSAEDQVIVTVSNVLPVQAGQDRQICNGESVTLGGSPTVQGGTAPYSLTWSPPGKVSSPNIANPNSSPTSTTTYIVQATDALGCYGADTVTISVVPNVIADAGPDKSVCSGDTATIGGPFTATYGTIPYTYQWTPTTRISNGFVKDPKAWPLVTTVYAVTVTDKNGCTDHDQMTLTVRQSPVVDAGPDLQICQGESIQIGGNPSASGGQVPYQYSWIPGIGLNSSSIANPTGSPSITTAYVLKVTDQQGCEGRDAMELTVHKLPQVHPGPDITVCDGQPREIGSKPSATGGLPPYTYIWMPSAGLSAPSAPNPKANPAATTWYTLTVSDQNGCVGSGDVRVEPIAGPNASFDQVINGLTVQFNNKSLNATGSKWYFGDGDSSSQANPIHTFPGDGLYEICLIVTNMEFCQDTVCEKLEITETSSVSPLAKLNVQVYPNPSHNTLHVQVDGIQEATALTLSDITGSVLLQRTMHSSGLLRMDIGHLPNGSYLLRLSNTTGVASIQVVKAGKP